MEQTRHRETACINQEPQELANLIRKLRWIDLEDEAQHLQLAMCGLPPQERCQFWGRRLLLIKVRAPQNS
jgi:hypothetical protein